MSNKPAASVSMVAAKKHFDHKDNHKGTRVSPDANTVNQIDHAVIDSRHLSDIINVRSCSGKNIDSNHYLIQIKIRARITNAKMGRGSKEKKYNVQILKNCTRMCTNCIIKKMKRANREYL